MKALPSAEHLRHLTIRLGKYLEIKSLDLVDIRQITSRYVIDLNLPCMQLELYTLFQFNFNLFLYVDEIIGLVNSLINKYPKIIPEKIEFNKTKMMNLEAISLSYILTVLIISCLYKPIDYSTKNKDKNKFSFLNWFNQMQNRLLRIQDEIIGM